MEKKLVRIPASGSNGGRGSVSHLYDARAGKVIGTDVINERTRLARNRDLPNHQEWVWPEETPCERSEEEVENA